MKVPRSPKMFFGLIAGALALLYPFLVYWGMDHLSPRILGTLIFCLVCCRFCFLLLFDKSGGKKNLPFLAAILCSSMISVLSNNPIFLMYVPIFISLIFLLAIGQSLVWPPTFIEQFARRDFPIMPPSAIQYCRKVTLAWCIFLLTNATIVFMIIHLGSSKWWALYSGMISYILMGLLIGGEYLIRQKIEPRFATDLEQMAAEGNKSS